MKNRKYAWLIGALLCVSTALAVPAAAEEGMLSAPAETESGSVFSGSQDAAADAELQEIGERIAAMLPADNGEWSFYIGKPGSSGSFICGDQPRQAASEIKLFIMGAVYERYNELCDAYGQEHIDELLRYMITVSDNDDANTLTTYLGDGDPDAGRAAVTAFCRNHGFEDTVMGRMLLAPTDNGDNITSVSDCGEFLMQVYRGAILGEEVSLSCTDRMMALLSAQERRHKIPAGIPEGISVANKTGELADVENDAAIVYDTPVQDFVLVFMGENLSEPGRGQETISQLSFEIYNSLNQ